PVIAWLVIVTVVGIAVGFQLFASRFADKDRGYFFELQLQGRMYVGLAEKLGRTGTIYQQAQETLNRGPYAQRLRFVVIAGEIEGPAEALARLQSIRDLWSQRPPSEEDENLTVLLEKLYGDYEEENWDAPSLSNEERSLLRQKLDWFGELALAPAQGS